MQAVLHTLEGLNERLVCDADALDEGDVAAVMAETGTPAGWYPLIPGYHALSNLPGERALPDDLRHMLVARGPDTAVSWQRTATAVPEAATLGDRSSPSHPAIRPQSEAASPYQVPGSGEVTLADRLRERLRTEDGDLGAQQAEALLQELTGQNLETWLRRAFFARHVRQFKYRPIAWQLASNPSAGGGKRKGGGKLVPAFECLIYAHRAGRDLLARIRTQYVAPLLTIERARRDAAHQGGDDTAAALATARVQELERFAESLRGVEEHGFAFGSKPNGQGLATDGLDDLLARERAWHADTNDGVRVNVAPLQLAGLLAGDVLKEPDARKAIADRARWRADERRWVREGVLPRCGWMGETIPESPRWTERAPEREAERAKLEGSAETGSSA